MHACILDWPSPWAGCVAELSFLTRKPPNLGKCQRAVCYSVSRMWYPGYVMAVEFSVSWEGFLSGNYISFLIYGCHFSEYFRLQQNGTFLHDGTFEILIIIVISIWTNKKTQTIAMTSGLCGWQFKDSGLGYSSFFFLIWPCIIHCLGSHSCSANEIKALIKINLIVYRTITEWSRHKKENPGSLLDVLLMFVTHKRKNVFAARFFR